MKITSWDANVFLCLIEWGLPEDVVKGMLKVAKRVHEEFSLEEAMTYWAFNSPSLGRVKWESQSGVRWALERRGVSLRTALWISLRQGFKRRNNVTKEFKIEWRLRSIEERQKKVIDWCKFGDEYEQRRHQDRLKCTISSYTKNLWKTWEAGASSYYFVGWDRRVSISKWYEGIHPGRFFLFYKENKIIEERNRDVPRGPCEDGYTYPKIPIFDWGPYEQLIEDLKCLDGGGLGECVGKTVEHIDDFFI